MQSEAELHPSKPSEVKIITVDGLGEEELYVALNRTDAQRIVLSTINQGPP